MFCTNCGNQLRDGAAFCPQCGARTALSESKSVSTSDAELNELLARADLLVAEEAAKAAAAPDIASEPAAQPTPPAPAAAASVVQPAQHVYFAPAATADPPKKKHRAGLIVLAVILAALLMAVAAFLSWKFFLADNDRVSASQNDPELDRNDDSEENGSQNADPNPDEAEDDPIASESDVKDPPEDPSDIPSDPQTPDRPQDTIEPEAPTEDEVFAEAEALLAAGSYDDAAALLAELETPSDREHFDALMTAALLNPEIVLVDTSAFPVIRIELHYSTTLFFANEIVLTEDGIPMEILTTNMDDARGVAEFTCTAADGETRSLQRTIGIQLVYDTFELHSDTIYQTPALVSRYELFFADVSWEEAVAECEAMGGHLITITSGDEMGIAVDLASANDALYTWIGGYTTVGPDGVVAEWITGEPMDYQLWAIGEPSGADRDGTVESCMMLWNVPSLGGWSWNDQRPDPIGDGFYAGEIAFICEWEEYVP